MSNKVLASPVARKLAKIKGIDISQVSGTGTNGRVMKRDINSFSSVAEQPATQTETRTIQNTPLKPVENKVMDFEGQLEKRVKMTPMRKAIQAGLSLSENKLIHTSVGVEINVEKLWNLRSSLNESLADEYVKFSFMPFFFKALQLALQEHPIFNASLDEKTSEIVYKNYYNLGFAAATDKGLVVPVIKNIETKTINQINDELMILIKKARSGKLSPAEMKDSTFTLTNQGSVGIDFGTAIINYPNIAIANIGNINKKPIYNKNGDIVPGYMMWLSVTFDHGLIDGADTGMFIKSIRKFLENPERILLGL